MADVALREDIYGGGPMNNLLRYWLSIDITREMAEQSLSTPTMAASGSFILRRSASSAGDYAVTVVEGRQLRSYKLTDLGLGQVAVSTGQAFASLEHLLEFFYDNPFPERGSGHVPLRIMHPNLVGVASPRNVSVARPHVPDTSQAALQARPAATRSSSNRHGGPSGGGGSASGGGSGGGGAAPPVPSSKRPGAVSRSGPPQEAYTPMAPPVAVVSSTYSGAPDLEFEEEFARSARIAPSPGRPSAPKVQPATIYGDDDSEVVYGEDAPKAHMIPTYGDDERDYRHPVAVNPLLYGDESSVDPPVVSSFGGTYGDEEDAGPKVRQGMAPYGDDGGDVHPALRGAKVMESPLFRNEAMLYGDEGPPLPARPGQAAAPSLPPARGGVPRGKAPPPPPQETYGDGGANTYGDSGNSIYGS